MRNFARCLNGPLLSALGAIGCCLGCGDSAKNDAPSESVTGASGSPSSQAGGVGAPGGQVGSAGAAAGAGASGGSNTAGGAGAAGVNAAGAAAGTAGAVAGSTAAGAAAAGMAGSSAGAATAGESQAGAESVAGTAGTAAGGSAGQASGGDAAGGDDTAMCEDGLSACAGTCVDLTMSNEHCGACNSPCIGGRSCVSGSCQCPDDGCEPLPAFPGADGAAAEVTGGRGGDVYHVTQLDTYFGDTQPGTLRYGLSDLSGPRTIVFDVSGVFSLGREPVSGWDSNGNGWDTASRLNIPSNVTIAGQSAPGPVIIMGGVVKPGGENIILRNVMFAPGYGSRNFDEPDQGPQAGDFPDSYVYDALDISGQNIMIDHVTTVYATDETISTNEEADNITVQYSNISQGQNYPQADAEADGVKYTGHALGSLLQSGSNARISILHNLYAHQKGRLPRVGTEPDALTVSGVGAFNDFRNNVFYNWFGTAGTGHSDQPSQNNFVGNFYLAGPGGDNASGNESTAISTDGGGTSIFDGDDSSATQVYHSGNLKDTNKDGDASDTTALTNSDFSDSNIQGGAFTQTPYLGVTNTAEAAFEYVLNYVGARYWDRGTVDQRIVDEVRTGSGRIVAWADDPFNSSAQEGTEWRSLISTPTTSHPAGFDTDGDGMPDEWEVAHDLDPSEDDHNGDFDADGYTNLEEYLNEIAAWPASAQVVFTGATNSRYALITNWNVGSAKTNTGTRRTAYWQPSRHDVAQIPAGTVVVDAVGQHARILQVAAPRGTASLTLSRGWLAVQDALRVGGSGAGEVVQTGGKLFADEIVLGGSAPEPARSSGTYRLRGGALSVRHLLAGRRGSFDFSGGTLHAQFVGFDLINRGGTIAPGNGVGHTEIAGGLELQSGALELELSGVLSDTLHVHGKVRLGGVLKIELRPGFLPKAGDAWTLLIADGPISGEFANVPSGFEVHEQGSRLILSFGPLLQSVAAYRLEEADASMESGCFAG